MDNKSSLTSLMSAFARAYHADTASVPIFSDAIAKKLISPEEYETIKGYIISGIDFFEPDKNFDNEAQMLDCVVNTHLAPTPLARARFCEDSLKTAIRTGTTQYVILGAGLDTFAWRKPDIMNQITVFEVDHNLTQNDKLERISRAGLGTPKNLHFVPTDFSTDSLRLRLSKAGFDETQKTFFSWLGVSYYLNQAEIENLLDEIASFAAEGSTLLFDYADESLFTATEKRVQNMIAMAKAGGEEMKFCTNELNLMSILDKHHFLIYESLSPDEINYKYFYGRNDGLSAFEHISYADAVLKGTPFINTKEKILQTALSLFAKNGYEAVSVKDIADRLSITKSALYKHYKDKRDIFNCIVKRMSEEDSERAKLYSVPEQDLASNTDAYKKTHIESLMLFTKAQFKYWTENPFACRFRQMLTIEQYRSSEMTKLYQQYLGSGPLGYINDIFSQILGKSQNASQLAVSFYSPVFMLYSVFDGATDKSRVSQMLEAHINSFAEQLTVMQNEVRNEKN